MLSREEESLLCWITERPCPVSMEEMQELEPPCFTSRRVESLRKLGLLDRSLDVRADVGAIAVYSISDSGRRALQEMQKIREDAAEHKAEERRKEHASLRREIIVAVVSSLVTLLVEHFQEVVRVLVGCIQTIFKCS